MLKIAGITLLELIITLIILGIIALAATPLLGSLYQKNRFETNLQRFVKALSYARTEALLSGQIVKVCPYTPALICGEKWSQGLLIFSKNKLIKIIAPLTKSSLRWNRKSNQISFSPLGQLIGQNGAFIYESTSKQPLPSKRIILSATGRIRVE